MTNDLRAFRQCFRKVDKLTIVFYKKDTIYIIDDEHQTIIQRWFKVRHSYSRWHRMCIGFKQRKHLTYGQALGIALRNGFGAASARKIPNWKGFQEYGKKGND